MKDEKDVMTLYDPKKRDSLFLYNWVHLGADLKSIARAPITFSEKLRVYAFECRRMIWDRKDLAGELASAALHVGRKMVKS